ncbi:hypothetical protein ES708_00127 [subsurface metagenome]
MRPVILDCTELYQNPVRTGIQRVVREIIRHWPGDGPELHVARFVPRSEDGLSSISAAAVDLLTDNNKAAVDLRPAELATMVHETSERGSRRALPADAHILLPEVFFEGARSAFYVWLAQSRPNDISAICYDFIPFLRPDLFGLRSTKNLMPYIRALRACSRLAHISDKTRREYADFIARSPDPDASVVLPLGTNGVAIERQVWRPNRTEFVTIGSIDGRKRQEVTAAAFRLLRERGHEVTLTVIGRAFDLHNISWLRDMAALPGFCWIEDASDALIADALRRARATIYVSGAEGYGLPPVESLWAGVPVIAPDNMPILAALEPLGQIRLAEVTPETVAEAMLQVTEVPIAERLWTEAARLRLPTWRDFARETAEWVSAGPSLRSA